MAVTRKRPIARGITCVILFLYNVVSKNYSVQNSSWGVGGGGGGSMAGPRSNKTNLHSVQRLLAILAALLQYRKLLSWILFSLPRFCMRVIGRRADDRNKP